MKKQKVGFAVVGLGTIAQASILPAFRHAKRAKLVALISRDKGKAQKLARKFKGCAAYSAGEFDAGLANPEVTAVYLATPQSEHLSATLAAARAGKHILSEKPLALNARQSAQMVQACEAAGVQFMTAYRKYYEPSALFLKKLIQSGQLGKLDMIHTAFSELHVRGHSLPWLIDSRISGGGPLMDLGIYCANNEDPVEVAAHSWKKDAAYFQDVEEGISFRMNFASGLIVDGSTTYSSVLSSFLWVQGSKTGRISRLHSPSTKRAASPEKSTANGSSAPFRSWTNSLPNWMPSPPPFKRESRSNPTAAKDTAICSSLTRFTRPRGKTRPWLLDTDF